MIDFLSKGFQSIINKLKGKKIIKEKDIAEIMDEIFNSLLEADVNYEVAINFKNRFKAKALGKEVYQKLNSYQQVIKILNETLIETLHSDNIVLNLSDNITTFMLVGLQGSGKTTVAGKLALLLRKKFQKKTLLIAADIYRPGAITQLRSIGDRVGVTVFFKTDVDVENIIYEGLKFATLNHYDAIIIDTTGTLNINHMMMKELQMIKKISNPSEVLLIIDVLFGKEIFNVAKSFHQQINATGVILTKMDSDTKGGAVLSVKEVTHLPIKLISSSEKMNDLEIFDAKRMASRLLGMGDILTVIEKISENIDNSERKDIIDRILHEDYNYYDLQKQLKTFKKMFSVSQFLRFIPGLSSKLGNLNLDDLQLNKFEFMIQSMTHAERKKPSLLTLSNRRRNRVVKGSGTANKDIKNLISLLEQQKKMVQQIHKTDSNNLDLQQSPEMILENLLKNKHNK